MNSKKPIESLIVNIRNQKVILDADLVALYGVPTKVFNQAAKRNFDRFPADFAFQLIAEEVVNLRSQFVTSSSQSAGFQKNAPNSSQIAMSSKTELVTNCDHLPNRHVKHQGRKLRP